MVEALTTSPAGVGRAEQGDGSNVFLPLINPAAFGSVEAFRGETPALGGLVPGRSADRFGKAGPHARRPRPPLLAGPDRERCEFTCGGTGPLCAGIRALWDRCAKADLGALTVHP